MEILDSNAALISNWEILHHLQSQKAKRSSDSSQKAKIQQNLRTLEFEIIQYLKDPAFSKCSKHTKQQISLFLSQFKDIPLKKAEKLQILNMHPESLLDLHLIIEECEERFTEEQLNDMLTSISILFAPPPPPAPTSNHQQSTTSLSNHHQQRKGQEEEMLLRETSMEKDAFLSDFNDI
jgi:hypothetical protein